MILMHQEIRVTPKKERQDDSETSVKEIGIENCLQPFLFREKLTPNKILSLFLSFPGSSFTWNFTVKKSNRTFETRRSTPTNFDDRNF